MRRRQWHPTPALLPGKSHGRRSPVGCSPWGRKESDMTEQLHFHFSLSCFGEGNGNPLQCSCLENPRDGGAWWAAVYGVAQSQTRLKRLSSSSSSSVFFVPKKGGGGRIGDPVILYSNRVLSLLVLVVTITLTIVMTITLRCLQETKTGCLPCFCCYFHFGGKTGG